MMTLRTSRNENRPNNQELIEEGADIEAADEAEDEDYEDRGGKCRKTHSLCHM